MKKNILVCVALLMSVGSFRATAQSYLLTKEYNRLFKNLSIVRHEGAYTCKYWLAPSPHVSDSLLTKFDGALLNDSLELRYIIIGKSSELTRPVYRSNNTINVTPGFGINGVDTTYTGWIAGLRFVNSKRWIPFTDTALINAYLRAKNKKFQKRYKRHMYFNGGAIAGTGIGLMGMTLMIDGAFFLFVFHPVFLPAYAVGAAVTAIGTLVYLRNGPIRVLHKILHDYNHA